MTISPTALDQFLTTTEDAAAAPPLPADPMPAEDDVVTPADPFAMPEGEQVAGLGSAVAGIAAKVTARTATKAKAAADAAARQAAMPEAAKAITPQVAQDIAAKTVIPGPKKTPPPAPLTKPPVDLFNYLRTGLPDDPNRFLDETAKAAGVKTPDVVSYKDEMAKLQAMGFKASDVEWVANYADNTQQMTRVAQSREILVAATKQAHDLAQKVVADPGNMALAAEYHQATQFLGVITRGVKNAQTDYARALGIMRMNPKGDLNALGELVTSVGGLENIVEHAQKLAKYDPSNPANAAKIANLSEAGMWSKAKGVWETTWINGLLSSPVTHAKNVVGNALFAGLQIPERAVASVIGGGDNLVRYMRGLDPREAVSMGESVAMVEGLINGTFDALATGARAFKENAPQFGTQTKLEFAQPQSISGDALGIGGWLGKGVDFYGAVVTMPGRALLAEDELFKVMNYSMELHAQASRSSSQAYRAAIEQGKSAADAELIAKATKQQILDMPPADIDAAAMGAARVNTFTEPLAFGSTGQSLQRLAQNNLAVKMFMPFIRTPINIMGETIQRTPFAPISKTWRDDVAAGGIRRDLALAKAGMGSTALMTFGYMASEGFLTGGGPGKKGTEENLQRSGWQPYSFVLPKPGEKDVQRLEEKFWRKNVVVGDDKVYVSYQGIEPFGGMLAIASDYAEYSRWQDDVGPVEEVAMGAVLGMGRYTSQLPYLQAMGELAQVFRKGGDAASMTKNILDWAGKQTGGFVIGGSPAGVYSSAQAAVERVADPERSETRQPKSTDPFLKGWYEAFDQYRSRVPGLSDALPPKLDKWGNVMKSGQGNWWELVSPIRVSHARQTPADRVLLENHMAPQMPSRDMAWQGGKGPFSGVNVELSHEQYNELITIYANEIRADGKSVQEALVAAAKDPAFERLNLGERQKYLSKIDNEYMNAARKTLFERHYNALLPQFESKRNTVEAYGYNSDELVR